MHFSIKAFTTNMIQFIQTCFYYAQFAIIYFYYEILNYDHIIKFIVVYI